MTPRIEHRSPNFEDRVIPIEYLLLHYTACNLEHALSIFTGSARQVSCHLLIAEDGDVFELVECWNGSAKRAWHAGQSEYVTSGASLRDFNGFSIGIELVNFNGNLLPFTDAQYEALRQCLDHLKQIYPALCDPERVLGHEHVAGWRGKADPGRLFNWHRFFAACYPGESPPQRYAMCPQTLADALAKFLPLVPADHAAATPFWLALSETTEAAVALQFSRRP